MALADVDRILVRANPIGRDTTEVRLGRVSLDVAVERNTGLGRANEVEQCRCPEGYRGLSCEDCAPGFTRSSAGLYLGLCVPCNCFGAADTCDPDTGACSGCSQGTTGLYCEKCEPGYSGDPVRGVPCRPVGGRRPPPQTQCNCHPEGSKSSQCYNGRCDCKPNAEGDNCDRCAVGFFGPTWASPSGCMRCWCSGVTDRCLPAKLFWSTLRLAITRPDHGIALTDK